MSALDLPLEPPPEPMLMSSLEPPPEPMLMSSLDPCLLPSCSDGPMDMTGIRDPQFLPEDMITNMPRTWHKKRHFEPPKVQEVDLTPHRK
jgi:hypothetical protein